MRAMMQIAKTHKRSLRRRSRLDSVINRLMAQRACLDHAAMIVAGRTGHVLEIGLGNGRTYHHLCSVMPNRDIFVFDRARQSHPEATPPAEQFFIGELAETMLCAAAALGPRAVLAHADIGSGRAEIDAQTVAVLNRHLPALLAPDAIVLCDQLLSNPLLQPQDLPPGVADGRYFMYRRSGFALHQRPRAVSSIEGIRAAWRKSEFADRSTQAAQRPAVRSRWHAGRFRPDA
jgi:hypothetical protein